MSLEITRRLMLGSLGALLSTTALAKPKSMHGGKGQPGSFTGISVDLAFADGSILAFSQADAADLGDYAGKFVRQHCFMHRQGAWTVFFRPDADSQRDEVVVEYGVWPVLQGVAPGHIRQPFTAKVRRGNQQLAEIAVPQQYWMTRWRWQSAPRLIRRTLGDLVAMRAHLPMSERALVGKVADFAHPGAVWRGPMGTAGLTTAMGSTGDRQEIGAITNLQASYLLRGNTAALAGMLAQAEAAGSFPMWLRDARDNNLLDVYKNPYRNIYAAGGMYPAPPLGSDGKKDPQFFVMNLAHMPDVTYVPWLLTDDPYYLEGSQMAAIYAATESSYHQTLHKLPGLANPSAPRAWAWGLRNILRMAAQAPESAPSWLQPRSYFRKMSDDNLAYANKHMVSSVKACRIFHIATGTNGLLCSWMEGYLLEVLGWAKWSGSLPEWNEAVDWLSEPLLRLTAPDSEGGWNRRWPAPNYVAVNKARIDSTVAVTNSTAINPPVAINTAVDPYAADTPDSWAELFELFKRGRAKIGKPLSIGADDKIYEQPADNPANCPSGPHYHEVVMGALGALAAAGVPGARERHEWMLSQMPAVYQAYNRGPRSFRYAYAGHTAGALGARRPL